MNEFDKQIEVTRIRDLNEFNTRTDLDEIRTLYKQNFDNIKLLIGKFGHKLSIEDISQIDEKLTAQFSENRLLLQQINLAIKNNEITKKDIK